MIGICIACFFAFLISSLTICTPFQGAWLQVDPVWRKSHTYTCTPHSATVTLASNLVVVPIDFIIAFMPLLIIGRLQRSPGQRIGLMLLFAIGFIASIGAIMKSYYFYVITYKYRINDTPKTFIWTNIEVRRVQNFDILQLLTYVLVLDVPRRNFCFRSRT
jgi:hypothetical protein